MTKIAVFPGSFDPITRGHEAIVRRSTTLFDKVIVAIGVNSQKQYFFPLEKRKMWLEAVFADLPSVAIKTYQGLTIDFCKSENAHFILRGLRNSTDFNYERSIAQTNHAISPEIETVFLLTDPHLSAINSTIIRDILRHGGDASQFVPSQVDLSQ